jgi:ketosteroid isomerase-like protein
VTGTADLVRRLYAAYNGRDVERLLTLVTDDVNWPDGLARMHGKDAVRDYWVRQWSRIHTHDEPSEPIELGDGRIAVHIHQTVRTPDGALVSTAHFIHVYRIRDGLAARLDIKSGEDHAGQPFSTRHAIVHPEGMAAADALRRTEGDDGEECAGGSRA